MYPFGYGLLYTQCAAVTIQSGLISDPPQICLPRARRETCHGQEWGLASCPLITREKEGRTPHPVSQGNCDIFSRFLGKFCYCCIFTFILPDPDIRKEGRGRKDKKFGHSLSPATHPYLSHQCTYVTDFGWLFQRKTC